MSSDPVFTLHSTPLDDTTFIEMCGTWSIHARPEYNGIYSVCAVDTASGDGSDIKAVHSFVSTQDACWRMRVLLGKENK